MNNIVPDLPAIEGGMPQRNDFLVFGRPQIEEEEIKEVVDSLRSKWIGTGPKVTRFENAVKEYLGCKYAVALNSCTAGLHLSLIVSGIKEGDEVITTPMTFASTANVIEHVGAKPVFADIELPSMNIDPKEIVKKITKKTKAILPVHMAGWPCRMDEIMEIAKKNDLVVIEDAAHAFGAEYKGRKIGTIGDLTAFSFYVTKNLTTGEGGMDIQAAIGIHQLKRFDENQKKRAKIWKLYNESFSDLPITTPSEPESDVKHAYHLYTILIDREKVHADREEILRALRAENIGVGVHFVALHLHPYYKKKYNLKRGDFPNAEYISDRTVSLPFSAELSDSDVQDVIEAVRKVILYYSRKS